MSGRNIASCAVVLFILMGACGVEKRGYRDCTIAYSHKEKSATDKRGAAHSARSRSSASREQSFAALALTRCEKRCSDLFSHYVDNDFHMTCNDVCRTAWGRERPGAGEREWVFSGHSNLHLSMVAGKV